MSGDRQHEHPDPASGAPAPGDSAAIARAMEQFLELLENDEAPEVGAFVQRYPKIAQELAECLEGIAFIHQVAPQLDDENTGGLHAQRIKPLAALGDFRIIRQIGQGGMGVVYEAEQLSLGRRVALKVLPFVAMIDARQLQRFRNEAQAAACLDHPNIVDVYGVGCERGVHYFAMRYVDGRSLAQVICELNESRGQEVCEASPSCFRGPHGSADNGVTREREPDRNEAVVGSSTSSRREPVDGFPAANDFTRPPVSAETSPPFAASISTWRSTAPAAYFQSVAHIGIQVADALEHAHEQGVIHRDIKPSNLLLHASGKAWVTDFGLAKLRSDPSMTKTGDIVGTLRYMSPEQALAGRVVVDHRTDIYSLGVTLYELLTLRPAFVADDPHELMRQISFDDPPLPRRLVRSIPLDLETIVLKAMEKDAGNRYSSAADLRDDLARFAQHQPIQARPPSVVDRVAKWTRRHQSIVKVSGAVVVVAFIVLAICTAWALWQRNEAIQQRALAENQRALAEQNCRRAIQEVTRSLLWLYADDFSAVSNVDELRETASRDAIHFFESFIDEESQDRTVRVQSGMSLVHVGHLYAVQQQREQAIDAYGRAITVLSELAAEFPSDCGFWRETAQAQNVLGIYLHYEGFPDQAQEQFASATDSFRHSLDLGREPRLLIPLADFLATCPDWRFRNTDLAVELAEEVVSKNDRGWGVLGAAYYRAGLFDRAVEALERHLQTQAVNGYDLYYLTLANLAAGNVEEGTRRYEQAVTWMSRNHARNRAFHSLRKESDDLFGELAKTAPD